MKGGFIILGILFGFNILAWLAGWYDLSRGELEVTFFDIGQGDSILIQGTVTKTSGLKS